MFQIKKGIVKKQVFLSIILRGLRLSVSVVLEEQPGRSSLSSVFSSRIILSPFQRFWEFWRPNALFRLQPILLSKVTKSCNITGPGFYVLVPRHYLFFQFRPGYFRHITAVACPLWNCCSSTTGEGTSWVSRSFFLSLLLLCAVSIIIPCTPAWIQLHVKLPLLARLLIILCLLFPC